MPYNFIWCQGRRINKILAIETSCDETAAAVVTADFKILSSTIYSQAALHRQTQGVVPERASREQAEKIIPTIKKALKEAGIVLEDIDAIAVTQGPGLIGSLLIGTETARALAWRKNLPLIPVNHIFGHIVSPLTDKTCHMNKLKFPILVLTASGGHTLLAIWENWRKLRVLGETQDDAAGEAFDKIATLLDLPYPGGPELEKLAQQFNRQPSITFPSPKVNDRDLNFSFSGLKTAVLYSMRAEYPEAPALRGKFASGMKPSPLAEQGMPRSPVRDNGSNGAGWLRRIPYHLRKNSRPDKSEIAQAAQTAIIQALVEKTYRAFLSSQVKTIFVTGGISANRALKSAFQRRFIGKAPLFFPPAGLTGDNAAMIAVAALILIKHKRQPFSFHFRANPNLTL